VKVDKVEETRAEAAAKAAAAAKLLAQEKADAEAGGAAMETEETAEAAETPAAAAAPAEEDAVGMEVDAAAEGGDAAAAADEKEPAELVEELTAFEDPELPENKTGWYELVAILTHKGQTADGGHYVAWVQHKGDTWVCFDDDKVTECRYASSPSHSSVSLASP
jgi:ubiquitin carboxyl-terminal hydrolase 14